MIKYSELNRFDVIELMLKEGSINPNRISMSPIRSAIECDSKEVIYLYLKDKRINKKKILNEIFYVSCMCGSIEIVKHLLNTLSLETLNYKGRIWNIINETSKKGRLDIFKELYNESRFDHRIHGSEYCYLLSTVQKNNIEIVKFLLDRIDLNAEHFYHKKIISESSKEVIDILITNPIFDKIYREYCTHLINVRKMLMN